MSPRIRLCQFAPAVNRGDAISKQAVEMHRAAEALGIESVLFEFGKGNETSVPVSMYTEYEAHSDDVVVLQYGGRRHYEDWVVRLPSRVFIYYHNVTPPGLWGTDEERDHLYQGQYGIGELAPYADLIVTPSPFNADQLVDEHAYDRDRIRVLHNAVALDRFAPGPKDADLVRRHKLAGRQVILFVGRLAGNKRIDLLVEALPLVQQKVPNAVLMLVGDDRTNPALKRIAANAVRIRGRYHGSPCPRKKRG